MKRRRQVIKRLSVLCAAALLLTGTPTMTALAEEEQSSTAVQMETETASGSDSGAQAGSGDTGSAIVADSAGMPAGPGGPGMGQDTGTLIEDRILDIVLNVGKNEQEVSVTWYTNGASDTKLQITKADKLVNGSFPTEAGAYSEYTATATKTTYEEYYSNSVTLTGLESGTAYAYRVSGTDTEGNVLWSDVCYYSPENVQNGFRFLIAGDPQIGSGNVTTDTEGWVNTMTAAVGQFADVSFLLSVGDQVNSASGNALENEYQGFLAENSLLSSIPFAPTVGNHDSNTITSYVTHNTLPNVSTYGSSNDTVTGDEDYSFRYGNTIFMMLNTNNSSIAEHKAFIEETLSNNQDAVWRVVAFHQSIYSVARHVNDGNIAELRTGLSPILAENDIDIVLMGHDHVYARSYIMGGETGMVADVQKDAEGNPVSKFTDPEGVQYVTFNSASGSKYYGITSELFEYTAVQSQEKSPNYSLATVDSGSFTITTYRSTDNTVVDTVTIRKTVETSGDAVNAAGSTGTSYVDWNWTLYELNTSKQEALANGESVVDMVTGTKTVVPSAVINEAVNKKITLAFHTGTGLCFSVDGNRIETTSENLNLTTGENVSIPKELTAELGQQATISKTLHMDASSLPVAVTLHLAMGTENAGKYANLYHYDTTEKRLICVGSFQIVENGQAAFDISTGGDYVVTVTDSAVATEQEVPNLAEMDYVVKKDDTLMKIAREHSVTLKELLAYNPQITNPDRIYCGQRIMFQK